MSNIPPGSDTIPSGKRIVVFDEKVGQYLPHYADRIRDIVNIGIKKGGLKFLKLPYPPSIHVLTSTTTQNKNNMNVQNKTHFQLWDYFCLSYDDSSGSGVLKGYIASIHKYGPGYLFEVSDGLKDKVVIVELQGHVL